ncbi:S41 family peptidase [uncultured Dokdonia sp.]|uniref:S41 family peptidase n=1 Tax=uncultured Dokdonia sp. TaxID=575653 RepID=UPI00260190D4|nr:S41 family peptidase [uncultured Dokdonia sp.]
MKKQYFIFLVIVCLGVFQSIAQDYGNLPKIPKSKLQLDFEIFKQALEKQHTGMYWYTPKDSVDVALNKGRAKITEDLNEIEFFKIIAPIVALTREDHTDIRLSEETELYLKNEAKYLPLRVVFLDKKMYITNQGISDEYTHLIKKEITSINGKSPIKLVEELGNLFASDGFIKVVKYSDLNGFSFSRYYFLQYGFIDTFTLKVKDENNREEEITIPALLAKESKANFKKYHTKKKPETDESLIFNIVNDTTAYLAVHTFSTDAYKENTVHKNYKRFLKNSFKTIEEKNITNLIIDVSDNGGGNEGNENLLYSYIGTNYQKYNSVCAKSQQTTLDNGVDTPISFKTFRFLERVFSNKKMENGGYCRTEKFGFGLMAYKKEPHTKYTGKLFVLISPVTYSGGSEFSNMVYTNKRATFVGEETGGGYYGNTSGYSVGIPLKYSKLTVIVPALKFDMNVSGSPFGRGVIPHHKVIPTIDEYMNAISAPLTYILEGKAIN